MIERLLPFVFPLFFAGMWLGITTILATKARWFDLARNYPDRPEEPLLRLRFQSGSMNQVSMRSILRLDACPSGLRVNIWRLFGPFSRSFFVPWTDIRVERLQRFWGDAAQLTFGADIGKLAIPSTFANRIARAVGAQWPEKGTLPVETAGKIFWDIFRPAAAVILFACAFFTLVPRLLAPGAAAPPLAVAIGFPVVVFGFSAVLSFLHRLRASRS